MHTVESIFCRTILNSHVLLAPEFVLRLAGGATGRGASPEGETISIYEDGHRSDDPQAVVRALARDGQLGAPHDQESFDAYLDARIAAFGRNTCYALSLAFMNAVAAADAAACSESSRRLPAPRLCLNILNGGRHAYTNPVLSDFTEYLLVAKSRDLHAAIARHAEIQDAVRRGLARLPFEDVGGNLVRRFAAADNRACVEFLLAVLDEAGCADEFDLMIDASAGDLWSGDGYVLSVTDGSRYSSEGFRDYWLGMLEQYPLRFLEDPFREQDLDAWTGLTTAQGTCAVIGDNFYSSDAARIAAGAAASRTTGAIIKPNQAGTVTAVRRAVAAAQAAGQIVITSHRSISTESTFVATLTCETGADAIKVGPLLTDYSSVLRLNEIIRLTGQ